MSRERAGALRRPAQSTPSISLGRVGPGRALMSSSWPPAGTVLSRHNHRGNPHTGRSPAWHTQRLQQNCRRRRRNLKTKDAHRIPLARTDSDLKPDASNVCIGRQMLGGPESALVTGSMLPTVCRRWAGGCVLVPMPIHRSHRHLTTGQMPPPAPPPWGPACSVQERCQVTVASCICC